MNLHFDFYEEDDVSFSLPCFILNLHHDTPANSAVYSLVSEKIFQNDENDAFDENENDDENLFEAFEQNEDFVIEVMQ